MYVLDECGVLGDAMYVQSADKAWDLPPVCAY